MPPQQTLQNARSTQHGNRDRESCPFRTLVARAAHKTYFRDETTARKRLGAHCLRLLCQPILEETGNAAVSGNFPRRYYPDRVQRDSLSLAARFSLLMSRETRAEAPLFRRRSLKHKSETPRKRGKARGGSKGKRTAFPFVPSARTLAQCREHQDASAAHACGKRLAVALRWQLSRARIKEQLSHARNNAPARRL